MVYTLKMTNDYAMTTEQIATMLEQAASQVRQMSSGRAAHSMGISPIQAHVEGADVVHGVLWPDAGPPSGRRR
jgi:hypothetical protein